MYRNALSGFNLAIEVLFFSSATRCTLDITYLLFQSRNRGTFLFKNLVSIQRGMRDNLFVSISQSRYFSFQDPRNNGKDSRGYPVDVSISQSRYFSFQDINHAVRRFGQALFQSRNRGTFLFKQAYVSADSHKSLQSLFQSRNRGTFLFK